MKKRFWMTVLFLFVPFVLIGCQSNTASENVAAKIAKVSISHSKGFQELNTDFFVEFEEEVVLEMFEDLLANAVQQEGIVDMAEPEFDVEILYEDESTQQFYLWLGEPNQTSTLMNLENTHIIYTVSANFTDDLIELLK